MSKPKDNGPITIQINPIEFNEFIGNKPPTKEEVGRHYIQQIKDNNFTLTQISKYEPESKETLIEFADEITAWAECEKNHKLLDLIDNFFNKNSFND